MRGREAYVGPSLVGAGLQWLGLWLGPSGHWEVRKRAPARALLLWRWHAPATHSLSPSAAHRSDRTATPDSNRYLLMPGPLVLPSDPLSSPSIVPMLQKRRLKLRELTCPRLHSRPGSGQPGIRTQVYLGSKPTFLPL